MIAKRNLFVSNRELEELFNLPEGVEILAVRGNKGYDGGFEFLLASAEEVDGITVMTDEGIDNIKRLSLSRLKEKMSDSEVDWSLSEKKDEESGVTNITINMLHGNEDRNQLVKHIVEDVKRLNNRKK